MLLRSTVALAFHSWRVVRGSDLPTFRYEYWTSPLQSARPGVFYPPNITPDEETGIGEWSDTQIANAVRSGVGRHGSRRIVTMPWQGYAKMTNDDVDAIVMYLRSIKPIKHQVPDPVDVGEKARNPFVYFGVYRSKP